jgi:hypothetical protein
MNWLDQFRVEPEPLSHEQRRWVWGATLLVALTRVALASRSLWDWDEALFSFALQDYDVTQHHPHPPGFPLFIVLGRLVRMVTGSDFLALQLVSLAGAVALFPLLFLLGRELRMQFPTAFTAASLLVFFPNVWFYGGTAFSDVPSLALVLFACVLLLRGCRSGGAYVAGAFVLAVAAGFRPQNLLVGLGPALIATWFRIRITRSVKQPLLAIVIGAVTLIATFGGAAMASNGWQQYRDAVTAHRTYIETVDSFRNPDRPGLLTLFDDFFVRPYRMPSVNAFLGILSAIGALGGLFLRRKPVTLALVTFGPFSIVGWLMLDHFSTGRFSVAWMPLLALAAADGSTIVADRIGALARSQRARTIAQVTIAALPILTLIIWTLPALVVVRTTDSPPVQAIDWIRRTIPPGTPLYVHGSMGPHANLLLRDYQPAYFDGDAPLVPPGRQRAWILTEGATEARGAKVFRYPRRRLRHIVRQRYFEVSVLPHCTQLQFGPGWYDAEGAETHGFRWMGSRASITLPPANGGSAQLSVRFYLPLDAISGAPTVTFTLDGKVVDRFAATTAHMERKYDVPARADRSHELVIQTDRFVNPAKAGLSGDTRDLGLRLDSVGWSARLDDCGRT